MKLAIQNTLEMVASMSFEGFCWVHRFYSVDVLNKEFWCLENDDIIAFIL